MSTHQKENDELTKETADLKVKYEDLKKECEEKMELMQKQIAEQDEKQNSIEDTLSGQIQNQIGEIHKQCDLYKEQTKVKVDEEKQLLSVLKEYKAKYQEYEKATKTSKKSHQTYQKELKALDQRKKQLANEQK